MQKASLVVLLHPSQSEQINFSLLLLWHRKWTEEREECDHICMEKGREKKAKERVMEVGKDT